MTLRKDNFLSWTLITLIFLLVFILPYSTLDLFIGKAIEPQLVEDGAIFLEDPRALAILATFGFTGQTTIEPQPLILDKPGIATITFLKKVSIDRLTVDDVTNGIQLESSLVFIDTLNPALSDSFGNIHARITLYSPGFSLSTHQIVKVNNAGASTPCTSCLIEQIDPAFVTFSIPAGINLWSGYEIDIFAIPPNVPPTQNNPLLNSSTLGNKSDSDITCTLVNPNDLEGNPITPIITYTLNTTPLTQLTLPFEGNDNTRNIIEYTTGANGTSIGALFNATGGAIGGAYTFDGIDDSLTFTDDPSLHLTDNFTIELWIKTTTTQNAHLLSKELNIIPQTGDSFYTLKQTGNSVLFTASDTYSPTNVITLTSTTPITNGNYHTIAITRTKGLGFFLSIDGVLVAQANDTLNGTIGTAATNLTIGSFNSTNAFYNGSLDHVQIYTKAIPLAQLLTHYQTINYHTIDESMLSKGQTWQCTITVNDGIADGEKKSSNILTILNSEPTSDNPVLTSTSGNSLDSDNLTCLAQNIQDSDFDTTFSIYNFLLQGLPYYFLNLPFENHLNSDITAIDYSGMGNNGSVSGATFGSTTGALNGGYSFDGIGDYIEILDDITLDYNTSISIDLWVSFNTLENHAPLINKKSTNPALNLTNYELRTGGNITNTSPNEIEFVSTFNGTQIHAYTTNGSALVPNTFYHVAVTKIGSSAPLIYVNGILRNASCTLGTCDKPIEPNNESLWIGVSVVDDNDKYLHGIVDEVHVTDLVLSPEQIAANAQFTYDTIIAEETFIGDTWECETTPHDNEAPGVTQLSNSLEVFDDSTGPGGSSSTTSGPVQYVFTWDVLNQSTATFTLQTGWKVYIVNLIEDVLYHASAGRIDHNVGTTSFIMYPLIGTFVLSDEEITPLDVDQDSNNDITMRISDLGFNKVTVTFSLASLTAPSAPPPPTPTIISLPPPTPLPVLPQPTVEQPQPPAPVEKPFKTYLWLFASILLILIMITLFILYKRMSSAS